MIADEKTLLPNVPATIEATKELADEGFCVMAYTNDDPVAALALEEAGAAAVMPLGAPIGSGLGILNPVNITIILNRASVPILVDAGVGTASDVSIAMELGADAVLMNTGVALADDPLTMAKAMKLGCEAGRLAFLAGRMEKRRTYASPSSPVAGRFTHVNGEAEHRRVRDRGRDLYSGLFILAHLVALREKRGQPFLPAPSPKPFRNVDIASVRSASVHGRR